MFFLNIIALIPLVFGSPAVKVKWLNKTNDSLKVTVEDDEPLRERCIKSGLEFRYRYELQLCRKRAAWFDSCKLQKIETRSIKLDPVSEAYEAMSDTHNDADPPTTDHLGTLSEALDALSTLKEVPLSFLSDGDPGFVKDGRPYVSIRVVSDCKGDYNRTVANISYFLTLGLIRMSGFDSGWKDFELSTE